MYVIDDNIDMCTKNSKESIKCSPLNETFSRVWVQFNIPLTGYKFDQVVKFSHNDKQCTTFASLCVKRFA